MQDVHPRYAPSRLGYRSRQHNDDRVSHFPPDLISPAEEQNLKQTRNKEETETKTTEDALAVVPHDGQKARWVELFHRLPTELHVHIMETMNDDPVAQICLGLTSKFFYDVFHMVKDSLLSDGTRKYLIRLRPLDLRMQISDDGQYMYHGWVEPWTYLDYSDDIHWHPPLGLLLQDEKIWGDLLYCEECARYKPNGAFERSTYEKAVEQKSTLR